MWVHVADKLRHVAGKKMADSEMCEQPRVMDYLTGEICIEGTADKDVAQPLKDFGLRISKLLGLDQQQSVQILQCYLQEDYRGTRNTLKVVLQDERQSQALLLKAEYSNCVNKLEKDLVNIYQKQFETLFKAESPTWETHGNLMTERQVSRWFLQCLREQSLLLEILFLYYAYFEMGPGDLLNFTKMFKEQGFGLRQTNRHLVDKSMDALVDRIGYFSCLILVEGMDIDFLHKCALEDRTEQHQFSNTPAISKEMDQMLLTFGDIPHHGPVLLAWVLLRHTLSPDESSPVIRRIGNTSLQLGVFQYLTTMLQGLGGTGNNCTASTARMCIYGLLSFVITSFEEETLGSQQHLINAACEVLSAPSLAELFWETKPTMGLGMILDSAMGMFPHKTGLLLQLLTALLSDKSTAKKVYIFLDKMSFYTEVYKTKPNDIISRDDETLWRRQAPKLLYPLGLGQTNLRIPQGVLGQVAVGEQGYMVRWDYSYSAWVLFTCEIEMLLHVVSTADVILHCERVKPILDLVHKMISTDWTVSDCLLPLTSRIYMLLQSAEGMKAGNYGNLLVLIEQPKGEYAVTIAFLRLVTTLVKGQLGSTQDKGLIPCCLILELVHAILNLSPEGEASGSTPTLQSLCIYSLANTEAGQAVVNIMGVGVDTIDVVLAAQPSSGGTEGPGQILIQTVKLAFSVTNNVIRLKPPSDAVSPLEQALTQHGGHGSNLIAVLAKYIYHKHDPALPRLAIQLLKRLATVAPMSVYACLGGDAAAIRDAFLTRLQSRTEDMRIKVMILEFLTVAVETQPGPHRALPQLGGQGRRRGEFLLGEWSCLQVVLDLIDSRQQGKYWCPALLHHITEPCVLETCAFVMKIIGLEIYYVVSGSLERSLKDALQKFSSGRRYEYWSQYVKSLVVHVAETEEEGVHSFSETQMVISAWRMLIILSTSHSDVMQLKEDSARLKLFMDVLDGTKAALLVPMSVPCLRLGSMMATLLLILLKQWRSVVATAPDVLAPLSLILESVLQADQQLMERTKAKVFSALLSALQIQGLNGGEISQLPQLLLCVCETVQDEALALIDSTRHTAQVRDIPEDKDSMETDAVRSVQKDQRDGGFSRKSQDAPCWPGVYRLSMSLMEILLKTLRYNFINEALDFVGVHQERILQCLNAVRTVQSLVCLDEADHTVGFLLQLSSFCKEWQFHLPQLLRDIQINLCYLCQTCTYLLHSRNMLHHYLQAKNGEALPSGPRAQRDPQTPSKAATEGGGGEREEAEQKALLAVQCSLLKILSKTLATLQHFTPDCCQILLDQCMDLAEYRTLFVLSFTTPAFDSDVAPSFGTLLATISVALSMLGEVEKKEPASLSVASLASSEETQALKSLLMFTMENCFYVLISQAVRCLKDPSIAPRDKQRLKQELGSELSTLLSSLSRHFRRGSPSSPASSLLPSPQTKTTTPGFKATHEGQEPFIQLVQAFVRHIQR
ncbi:unnamed protein product [Coregonus sp. 'balchen']|nr:unnamed protein product [Coregonus sp. 'balchen']